MNSILEIKCILKYIFLKGGIFRFILFNMTKIFYKIFRKKPISNYPKKYKKLLLNISYQLRKKLYNK